MEASTTLNDKYKYWRLRSFLGIYVGYFFYYFTRKSFTFAVPALIEELNFQLTDLGMIGSVLTIAYATSKFCSGILSDYSNPRYFMSWGLILTGVFNIFFGLSSSIWLFILFWGLNGWFQGFGWPPCAKILTTWFSQNERGKWWGFWNTCQNLGGAIIPFIVGIAIQMGNWRYGLFIPGVLAILVGFFIMNRLRGTPDSLGLPAIEEFRNDYPAERSEQDDKTYSMRQMLFKFVVNNKFIWVLSISYFFIYVVRQSINDFGALFLIRTKEYSMVAAYSTIFWFEIGGIFGSLAGGWLSDSLLKGSRTPINVCFSALAVLSTFLLYLTPQNMILLDSILMFIIGFFLFGPQMLIGIHAAEVSHKKAVGAATGFVGCWAYFGATVAGYPITKVIESFGWHGFFLTLYVCGIITSLLLIPMWNIKTNPTLVRKPIGEME